MKIALINENSQAAKNEMICNALKKVVEPMGHEVYNYGMYTAEDECQLTYVQAGILAAVLLNSGAADYVITGCGTGEGAMLACNSFPGVICGHVEDALDAYTFAQINDGNAIAIPFAKGFGWGGDLNLEYIFEKLYVEESGQGYPRERAVPEQRNKKILDEVKTVTYRSLTDILRELDRELVKGALSGAKFQEYFFANCKDEEIASVVKEILGLSKEKSGYGEAASDKIRYPRRGMAEMCMFSAGISFLFGYFTSLISVSGQYLKTALPRISSRLTKVFSQKRESRELFRLSPMTK